MAETFIWGAGGQRLTPAQAKARREAAETLRQDNRTPATFGEGLASIGRALEGVAYDRSATEAEAQQAIERQAIMDGLMGMNDPTMQDIYAALGNEVVASDPTSAAIINSMVGDERQQADWARQDQRWNAEVARDDARYAAQIAREDELRAADLARLESDPLRLAQIEAAILGNEATRLQLDTARAAPVPLPEAPPLETIFDPVTGREQVVQWNGQLNDWEPVGGVQAEGEPLVNVNTGENGSAFLKKADENAAARLDAIITSGQGAAQFMGDLQTLAALGSQIDTGKGAELMNAFGPYAQAVGIDIQGLGEAQAYQAIIDRLAPQMRPAGAGATSDFDARQFLSSLPGLGKTPEGNEIIMQTLTAMQEHRMAAAQLAELAHLPTDQGGITWQEAERRIRELPNPYDGFNEFNKRGNAAMGARDAQNAAEAGSIDYTADTPPPGWGGNPELWQHMPPEDRALW